MPRKWSVPATVLEVVDGDTVRLDLDLGWHIRLTARCRIAGINAPEMNVPEGKAAKAYAQTLLKPGDEVGFLSTSLDKYGRPLGEIVLANLTIFSDLMLSAGHAAPCTY